jgi:hypothetical protein
MIRQKILKEFHDHRNNIDLDLHWAECENTRSKLYGIGKQRCVVCARFLRLLRK